MAWPAPAVAAPGLYRSQPPADNPEERPNSARMANIVIRGPILWYHDAMVSTASPCGSAIRCSGPKATPPPRRSSSTPPAGYRTSALHGHLESSSATRWALGVAPPSPRSRVNQLAAARRLRLSHGRRPRAGAERAAVRRTISVALRARRSSRSCYTPQFGPHEHDA